MSRKTIFIFAATVILLYFSIILYVLSPLHGLRGSYYGNSYIHHFGFRHIPSINWCRELRWRSPQSSGTVALVSHPGSGNTWLRYLLQQATGIFTGSIYMDYGLRVHGFPAENVANESVLVVKTHELLSLPTKFTSAILLIRHPRDAILADFNRLHKGHIGSASKSAFVVNSDHKNPGKPDWSSYVSTQLAHWVLLHKQWLKKFPGPIHVVFYEALVQNTKQTLEKMLAFLNYTVTEEDMSCVMANKEGIYRRLKVHNGFDPFTPDMYKALQNKWHLVRTLVADHQRLHSRRNFNISMSKR